MPHLNVDELIGDRDFFDNITVIRSRRRVGQDGRTIDSPTSTFPTTGAVTPASGTDLFVLPEAERVGSFIKVLTPYYLFALSETTAPDIIVWRTKHYQVKNVADYKHYGAGFVNAICELLEYATGS